MDYRVLGRVEVRRNGAAVDLGAFRQRSLVALLLMNANSIVSTDQILEELWDEDAAADRQNTLWVYVSNLRKALDPDREKRSEGEVLLTRAPGYVLHVEPDQLDSVRFERMVAEGRSLAETDPAAASLILSEALGMWNGRAYEDYSYERFAQTEIARLEELRLEAVEARIEADLQRGMSRELVSELESLVRQHPVREQFTAQLMLSLYRSGRQAEALRSYQMLKSRLGEELGIEPSSPLQSLEERIVTADVSLDQPRSTGVSAEPGLAVRGYELREKIGEGAFGVAYRAYQPAVGREVAIKVIRPELANSPTFIRRFEAEAQLVARLEHPHIVPLYDYWREPDAAYLVMRLMKGGNLADVIDTSALTIVEAARIAEQIGSALHTAHEHGVIHRDIKPANILIDDDGNAYLSDFGIAVADEGPDIDEYLQAITLGPPYASPEQLGRQPVNESSDVYSLGVVLAQALTGLSGEVAQVRGALDPAVGRIIDRATDADPADRYETVGAFAADFQHAVGQESAVPFAEDARNPFKGLRSFDQADSGDFYGREALVDRLLDRLGKRGTRSRFVALVGPSGSGKSSVVKAGLVPALAGGALPMSSEWFTVEMSPAPHPFEELESALLDIAVDPPSSLLEDLAEEDGLRKAVSRVIPEEGSQLLIVVDQFEELFTQIEEETANRFLEMIAETVRDDRSRIRVVVTMRADFYDRPLRHRAFGELLREGTEVITPMSQEELERAINGPAESVGVHFDPGLVGRLISDVSDRPGALPLLQYTLTELFESREGASVGIEAYHELGGISGALAERAEGLVAGLTPSARECAREVFLNLITLGEGAEDTRRRVLVSELEQLPVHGTDLSTVLQTFGRHRMLSFDRDPITRGPTVEISHEALLTEWGRLRRMIDEARIDVRQQRNLRRAAIEWDSATRDESFLLTPGRLARFEEWLPLASVRIGALEEEYLSASRARRDEAEKELEDQRRREAEQLERQAALEAESNRRLRLVSVVLAVGVAVAGILGIFGFLQSREAGRQRDDAEIAREDANVQRVLAEARAEEAVAAQTDAEAQREAAESVAALRTAEGLPDVSLGLRSEDPQLALLLAGEAIAAAHDTGAPMERAVASLHMALQGVNAPFPDDADDVALVSAPEGNRGVFVLPVVDLLRMQEENVERPLSDTECQEFLGRSCPVGAVASRLPTSVLEAAFVEPRRVLPALSGSSLTVSVPRFDYGLNDVEWEIELGDFERGIGPNVDAQLTFVGQSPNADPRLGYYDGLTVESFEGRDLIVLPWLVFNRLVGADITPRSLSGLLSTQRILQSVSPRMNDSLIEDGEQVGLWTSFESLSMVWYRADILGALGQEPPETWSEILEVTRAIADEGLTPWCVGVEGPDAPIPVMNVIQSQVVDIGGIDLYDQWVAHQVEANDPRIVEAHRRAAEILFDERFNGGRAAAALRATRTSGLTADDPACVMWPAPAYWLVGPLTNFRFEAPQIGAYPLPTATDDPNTSFVTGTVIAMLTDRPESRALMSVIASQEHGRITAEQGQSSTVAANIRLDPTIYARGEVEPVAAALRASALTDAVRLGFFESVPELYTVYLDLLPRWFEAGPDADIASLLIEVEAAWQELDALNGEG